MGERAGAGWGGRGGDGAGVPAGSEEWAPQAVAGGESVGVPQWGTDAQRVGAGGGLAREGTTTSVCRTETPGRARSMAAQMEKQCSAYGVKQP